MVERKTIQETLSFLALATMGLLAYCYTEIDELAPVWSSIVR